MINISNRTPAFVLAIILCVFATCAQPGAVTIRITQPPPNQFRMSDVWKGQIVNATPNTIRVYLHASVEEISRTTGIVVDARSKQIDLLPGITSISGAQVEPFTVDKYNKDYYNVILQSGSMPSGDYRGCTEVIEVTTGGVLATTCNDVVIQRTSQPFLVAPVNETFVRDQYPTFSWMSATPPLNRDEIVYRLRIAEIYGTQTPQDAAKRNPAFLDVSELRRTLLMYPVSARRLAVGQRYAWYVGAYERIGSSFQYLGESEVWQFTYTDAPLRMDSSLSAHSAIRLFSCPGENWDFETGTYSCWVAEGDAFEQSPIRDDHPVFGLVQQHRRYWVSSYGTDLGDGARGELRSQEFVITSDKIQLHVGGSNQADACVELLVSKNDNDTLQGPRRRIAGMTGNFVVVATSHVDGRGARERLDPIVWDVRQLKQRQAVILVRDWSSSAHVNLDAVRFLDDDSGQK
ncbi:MAG: hypothetical protein FJ211_02355 [Ignavibacteria bacterium]|nr:hypothetical protein [Ignavibacteria bacterium]